MSRHQITRVRHELRRRRLTLAEVERLTPNMLRLHFTSPDLDDFASASFDDHVKMFIGPPGAFDGPPGGPGGPGGGRPGGSGGPGGPGGGGGPGGPGGGGRPEMRDFTPRRFDAAKGTMAIDYAVHDAGPAVEWAMKAKVGDVLQVGGPRGSSVIPDDFDWYWLIGDESALPAIGRRLEELRAGIPVTSFVLIADAADAQAIDTAADWTPHWLVRSAGDDGSATLREALSGQALPPGEGFVWIAAEAGVARAARSVVVDNLGHPREWTKAAGYWQRGVADAHGRIED